MESQFAARSEAAPAWQPATHPSHSAGEQAPGVLQSLVDPGPTPFSVSDVSGSATPALALEREIQRQHRLVCARIDEQFAWLMLLQWAAAIAVALWITPFTWAGDLNSIHPHVTLSILYGGVLTLIPVLLTRVAPGERLTRLTIAAMQMLMSSLLIHLTGGRLETHFHIFGSLAFLAFYFDWQVLVVASATIAVDHILRGYFLPYSIFGTYTVQPWRWLEHAGWVVFSDVFLILGCNDRMKLLRFRTERQFERDKLLKNALYDTLTGLPNRTCLSDRIAEAIRRHSANHAPDGLSGGRYDGFSCLYIDLDRFKDVNDQWGHIAGDQILVLAAERIQSRLSEDAFLARFGGDEFLVLQPQSADQPLRAEETARAILRSLRQPFDLEGNPVTLGASIGISRYPQDAQDESELLIKSDRALIHVKRSGRNDAFTYSPAVDAQSAQREEAERQLLRAIEKNEFRLLYQPICHASGGIAGFEALIRWFDPVRGLIPPSDFIPLAEETGLIVQLGAFVLHEACRQASEWHSRGILRGSIAVNVSSIELAREDFADSVKLTLRQHYTPPHCIEIEVTESALGSDFALAERHLRELREFGIEISMDDFGTGYSSLGRLRQLTLDTLKIDRIFIDGVATSDADRTVVEHIIAMAHTLSMRVIAEGVETEDQLNVLRALGCDRIQGFFLSRPLKTEDAEARLLDALTASESQLQPANPRIRNLG